MLIQVESLSTLLNNRVTAGFETAAVDPLAPNWVELLSAAANTDGVILEHLPEDDPTVTDIRNTQIRLNDTLIYSTPLQTLAPDERLFIPAGTKIEYDDRKSTGGFVKVFLSSFAWAPAPPATIGNGDGGVKFVTFTNNSNNKDEDFEVSCICRLGRVSNPSRTKIFMRDGKAVTVTDDIATVRAAIEAA